MKEFTQDMLNKLRDATNSVKGTKDYNKYYMENSHKWDGKREWHFDGFSIPYNIGTISQFKGKLYIKVTRPCDHCTERWTITPTVRELLNL